MVGMLVVTHQRLAQELVATAELIVGQIDKCVGLSLDPDLPVDDRHYFSGYTGFRRQADVNGPSACEVVHPAGEHYGKDSTNRFRSEDGSFGARGHPDVRQGCGHACELNDVYIDAALPCVGLDSFLDGITHFVHTSQKIAHGSIAERS